MKIGIIGHGYVGKAVAASYDNNLLIISDPAYPELNQPIDKLKQDCDCIYICVPTPQSKTGECDTSILESVIDQLQGYTGIVISKSTASPHTYRRISQESNLKFSHVPEFLTAVNAVDDYLNPQKIVIGCDQPIHDEVAKFVITDKMSWNGQVEYCSVAEASFFKYLANTMLAIKVIVNNEYADLADALDINWNKIVELAHTDQRLGHTHWSVPGPDGQYGFGGACFPKDTSALSAIANDAGVAMTVLTVAINKNFELRSDVSKPVTSE